MTVHTLWTVGHSTRSWEEFVALLAAAQIEAIADVRRFPASRRHPQFSGEAMADALPRDGIAYLPFPQLGGRREARKDSPNSAWRHPAFRGYADYMQTPAWHAARDRLAEVAAKQRTAILCAEAVWWQCRRQLIADDFKANGWEVIHLMANGRSEPHPYSSAARIVDGKLDYSPAPPPQGSLF